jgi:hypothetical protein
MNSLLKINDSLFKLAILKLNIPNVIEADSSRSEVGHLQKHITRFGQINHRQCILLEHEVVVFELLCPDECFE